MQRAHIGGLLAVGVLLAAAAPAAAAPPFADPTATLRGDVRLGDDVYVAPFARLDGRAHRIAIGRSSNVQDSVEVSAARGAVRLGPYAILAHGASVRGPASVGIGGVCAVAPCPSFVSFNARVDGGTVQRDAMVQGLARVGPGVTIPSGRKVLPGRSVDSQAEVATETEPVTDADREFMEGVIKVNVEFASGYAELADDSRANVHGIGPEPSSTDHGAVLPRLAGRPVRKPGYRNRIIGAVRLEDGFRALLRVLGSHISLRADEGQPFWIGTIARMADHTTVHALEKTTVRLGDRGRYGRRSIVHGGPTTGYVTGTGDGVRIGDGAVLFRSHAGDGAVIGERSLVQVTDLPAGAVVPARTVIIGGVVVGRVEW